jgi:hypothetical protein
MSAEQLTSLAALVAAVGGVLAVILGFLNRRAARNAETKAAAAKVAADAAKVAAENSQREIIATKDGIRILGERIDGQLDKLLAGARAEGHAQGEQAQRDRSSGPTA